MPCSRQRIGGREHGDHWHARDAACMRGAGPPFPPPPRPPYDPRCLPPRLQKEYLPSAVVAKRMQNKWPRPEWHAPWKMYRVISGHLG